MGFTKKDLKKVLRGLPKDTPIAINSIYDGGEWHLSPVSECHYDKKRNTVCITPEVVSI